MGSVRVPPLDRRVLAFMAEHQVVVRRQVAILTGSGPEAARRRLSRLRRAEYVHFENGFGQDAWLISRAGLTAVGSELPPPELKLANYRHSVGLAWLWLAAWAEAFGPVAEVLGERRIRSHDAARVSPEELYSIRLGGYEATGHERRHYPDVLLIDPQGRRLALELELSPKRVAARREILGGYGADRRLDGVLYLVENNEAGGSIARGVRATAAEMDLRERVHVRRVSPILPAPRSRGARERAGSRGRPPAGAGRSLAAASAPETGR